MREERYNVFTRIHKGLRAFLFDTALTIQKTDFASPDAELTVKQVEEVLNLINQHGRHEEHLVLQFAYKYNPLLVDELQRDHKVISKLTEEILDEVEEFKKTIDPDKKDVVGRKIQHAFNEFIAFDLYHMNREENDLMCVLWKQFTDAEIFAIETKMINTITSNSLFAKEQWIMRSINKSETATWLMASKHITPAPVFNAYLAMAEEELSKITWTPLPVETIHEIYDEV